MTTVLRRAAAGSLALALALTLALSLRAQDFAFHEIGARAASLGGAFTARADDITAIFYNPAGLAFLDGLRLETNLVFGARKIGARLSDTGLTFPTAQPELRGSHFLAWRPVKGVGLGVGLYSPFNFDSRWPRLWSGEGVSISAALNAQTIRPVVAVEPLRGLAFGAGLDIVSLHMGWEHKLFFDLETYPLARPAEVASLHAARGRGLGWTAGAMWTTLPWLRLGARFQQGVTIDLVGVNDFVFDVESMYEPIPAPNARFRALVDMLDIFYAEQTVRSRIRLPREVACGVAVTPVRTMTFSVDLQWDHWSDFGPWQFTSVNEGGDLSPEFLQIYRDFYGIEPDYGVQGVDLGLVDTRTVKAGLEYRQGRWFAFRAGWARHGSSVSAAGRTPLFPDTGMTIYSLGAGYEGPLFAIWDPEEAISYLSLDLFARYAASDTVTSPLVDSELIYHGDRWVVGIGVGFTF